MIFLWFSYINSHPPARFPIHRPAVIQRKAPVVDSKALSAEIDSVVVRTATGWPVILLRRFSEIASSIATCWLVVFLEHD